MTMLETEAHQIRAELNGNKLTPVYDREAELGKVLKRSKAPGDTLNLLSLTSRVRVFDLPSGLVFCVNFPDPDAQFYGARFIDLLNQARKREKPNQLPYHSRLFTGGTIDDWRMPDQVPYGYNRQLDDHLEGLGKPFKDFHEKDRRKYLDAASPMNGNSSESFMSGLSNMFLTQQMAEKWMQTAEKNCQGALLAVSSVHSLTWNQSIGAGVSTRIPFFDLPQSSKDIIIQASRTAAIRNRKVIDPQAPPAVIGEGLSEFAPSSIPYPYRISHLGKGRVEITHGKSKVLFNFRGRSPWKISQYIADESEYYMLPRQVWAMSKSTGSRLWLDEILPNSLSEGVDPRANTRLGFVLATVLSDKGRDRLPDKLSLSPGGREQPLREAQMPVLLYLTEEDIKKMVGEDHPDQIIDPHVTILNGSYFKACERSTHLT